MKLWYKFDETLDPSARQGVLPSVSSIHPGDNFFMLLISISGKGVDIKNKHC